MGGRNLLHSVKLGIFTHGCAARSSVRILLYMGWFLLIATQNTVCDWRWILSWWIYIETWLLLLHAASCMSRNVRRPLCEAGLSSCVFFFFFLSGNATCSASPDGLMASCRHIPPHWACGGRTNRQTALTEQTVHDKTNNSSTYWLTDCCLQKKHWDNHWLLQWSNMGSFWGNSCHLYGEMENLKMNIITLKLGWSLI